ncbi:MAG: formylglycine-generating enzyme family protein [Rikenellaceae bacterium]|nr:formylglycine-generating enzyme family protein [Rikenellaceae bacterium]
MKRFLITMAAILLCAPCLFATTPSDDAESQGQQTQPANFTVTVGDVTFKMIWVEGGRFDMGSPAGVGNSNEQPRHSVTLDGYWIAETEVTQGLWRAVMGAEKGWTQGYGYGTNYPAYYVSYTEAIDFCKELNAKTNYKYNFTLPTEAQWEYAARGGNKSNGYTYSGSNTLDNVAWYWNNSNGNNGNTYGTHEVKTKSSNELGIYDMSGNVWEWCSDWYGKNYYKESPPKNPKGPSTGDRRVLRGGSWAALPITAESLIATARNPGSSDFDFGFRLAVSSSL